MQKSINFDDPSIDTATKNDYRINGWGMANTAQKWSFPLRISSVNVTKSAVSSGFGQINWRNP